jgi:hypothetical protein
VVAVGTGTVVAGTGTVVTGGGTGVWVVQPAKSIARNSTAKIGSRKDFILYSSGTVY